MPDENAITHHQQMMPSWVAAMRQAAMDGISEQDVREIVAHQVALAKDGDKNALKFVFDQVLGGAHIKGATFVQNNNYDGINPGKPTPHKPGSKEKVELMRRRVEAGLPAIDPDDEDDADA